jgi:uncharacterized protein YndB with AHSA1/START domain
MNRPAIALGAAALALIGQAPASADRILRAERVVHAPVNEVWKAWTTNEGIASFFAPQGRVDLRIDGTYDVWFDPSAEPGLRGAEGMRILDVDPEKRFAFTWNAPASIPSIRGKRTLVVLEFAAEGKEATRLRFTHTGWGEGDDWDRAYDYFDRAWGAYVLPNLARRFDRGPLDWSAPPKPDADAPSLKQVLEPKSR